MRLSGLNSMTLVLFNDHMKDHDNGCTFGGCASYSMSSQPNWNIYHVSAGFGLYTSNEWPHSLYDTFSDTGSCTNYHHIYDNETSVAFAVGGSFLYAWGAYDTPSIYGLFGDLDQRAVRWDAYTDIGSPNYRLLGRWYYCTGSCTIYLQRTSSTNENRDLS